MTIEKYTLMNLGGMSGCCGFGSNDLMGNLGSLAGCAGASYEQIAWFQQAVSCCDGSMPRAAKKQTLVNLGANLVMGVAQKILGGGGSGASKKAEEKVKNDVAKVEEIAAEANEEIEENNNKIDEVISEAKRITEDINNKLKKINDENDEKENIQKELEKQNKIITDNQQILENSASTEEEKNQAKENINKAGNSISELQSRVDNLIKSIKTNDETVEQSNADLTQANEQTSQIQNNTQNIQNDAVSKTQNIQQQVTAENTTSAAKETAEATALAAQAVTIKAGGSVTSFVTGGFSGVAADIKAEELLAESADKTQAAQSYTKGIATVSTESQKQVVIPVVGSATAIVNAAIQNFQTIGDGETSAYAYRDASNSVGSALTEINEELDELIQET